MATFRTEADWHRYHATEGFIVGRAICPACNSNRIVGVHPETKPVILECGNCGVLHGHFTHLPTPPKYP